MFFLYYEVHCTLVEPPSASDNDEHGTDGKATGSGTVSNDISMEDEEENQRQRQAFEKIRFKIKRNLHVLSPLVTAVSQLGQEMLGGIEIIDFKSPRYIHQRFR